MKTTNRTETLTRTINLQVGDIILDSNREIEVTKIERAENIGRRMMFRVSLSTGRTLTSAADARWTKVTK